MPIDRDEVLRIAALARLRVSPEEAEALAGDLDRIVAHIDSLREVELPDDSGSLTYFDQDVHREDRAGESLSRDDALKNAAETDGEFFLVPQVVDKPGGKTRDDRATRSGGDDAGRGGDR